MTEDRNRMYKRSPETQSIVDRLRDVNHGEVVTYEELANAANASAEDKHFRGRVRTARKIALNEHGCLFEAVTKVGVRRVPENEVHLAVDGDLNRMRRTAQRGRNKIKKGIVDFEQLDRDTKQVLMVQNGCLSAIELVTDRKSRRRLREYVEVSNQDLNFGRTMDLIKD